MIDLAQARALVRSPQWPQISELLWGFAPLVDSGRRAAVFAAALPESAAATLERSMFQRPTASRWFLSQLGVESVFHDFPATDGSRLLLLSSADYLALADRLGVVAHAPALRRLMDGAKVRALRAALPGAYPEALRLEAYFHAWRDLLAASAGGSGAEPPSVAAIRLAGLRLLATALSPLPPQLLLRQRLRFPPALDPGFEPLADDDGGKTAEMAKPCLAKMLQLTHPEQYAQCFS